MEQQELKQKAALAALKYVEEGSIIGVGTGSTVNFFIAELAKNKMQIKGAVASSIATEKLLKQYNIEVLNLNNVNELPIYVDGADEINGALQMIKGGGGALTREKIVASVAQKFICIADGSKKVETLGKFPLAIEVIPMARSYVARELVKMGANPIYRENFVTDNGNVILDAWFFEILEPLTLEKRLNNITGVVCNGLFALRPADVLLLASIDGVRVIAASN